MDENLTTEQLGQLIRAAEDALLERQMAAGLAREDRADARELLSVELARAIYAAGVQRGADAAAGPAAQAGADAAMRAMQRPKVTTVERDDHGRIESITEESA